MDYAFQYMIDSQKGTDDTEQSYPYKGRNGECKFSTSSAFKDAKITGFVDLKTEDELVDATANIGPISVAVYRSIISSLLSHFSGEEREPFLAALSWWNLEPSCLRRKETRSCSLKPFCSF